MNDYIFSSYDLAMKLIGEADFIYFRELKHPRLDLLIDLYDREADRCRDLVRCLYPYEKGEFIDFCSVELRSYPFSSFKYRINGNNFIARPHSASLYRLLDQVSNLKLFEPINTISNQFIVVQKIFEPRICSDQVRNAVCDLKRAYRIVDLEPNNFFETSNGKVIADLECAFTPIKFVNVHSNTMDALHFQTLNQDVRARISTPKNLTLRDHLIGTDCETNNDIKTRIIMFPTFWYILIIRKSFFLSENKRKTIIREILQNSKFRSGLYQEKIIIEVEVDCLSRALIPTFYTHKNSRSLYFEDSLISDKYFDLSGGEAIEIMS